MALFIIRDKTTKTRQKEEMWGSMTYRGAKIVENKKKTFDYFNPFYGW